MEGVAGVGRGREGWRVEEGHLVAAGSHTPSGRDRPCSPRTLPSSIFRDEDSCDIGKSQSKWTDSKMETPGPPQEATLPPPPPMILIRTPGPWSLAAAEKSGAGAAREGE
jgi:hypothetical protein